MCEMEYNRHLRIYDVTQLVFNIVVKSNTKFDLLIRVYQFKKVVQGILLTVRIL